MLVQLSLALLLLQSGNDAIVPVPRPDAWWQHRHEAVVLRAAMGNADLVFIGDSITHAFGGDPFTGEDFANRGADTWNLFYGDRKAVNLGFSGDRTQHVLWRLDHGEMDGIHPKAIVIMIGTNNVRSNTSDQIAEGVEAVCEKAHEKAPEAKELLLAIFPREGAQSKLRANNDGANKLLEPWAKAHGVTFLDIARAFLDANGDTPADIMPDHLHPNAYGYRKWAMAMEPTLAKLLDQRPKTTDNPNVSTLVPVTQNRDGMNDWMPRHGHILQEIKDHPDTGLVFIGDSITQGWDGPGRQVWSDFEKWKPLNEGYGWDRIENALWRVEQGELDGIHPKAIVIMIGTNNLGLNSASEIVEGISALLRDIREKQPRAQILLLNIFPRGQKPDDSGRLQAAEVNKMLAAMPKPRGVTYLTLWDPFLSPDGTISTEMMPDFLHPTEKGYRVEEAGIMPFLKKVLGG